MVLKGIIIVDVEKLITKNYVYHWINQGKIGRLWLIKKKTIRNK